MLTQAAGGAAKNSRRAQQPAGSAPQTNPLPFLLRNEMPGYCGATVLERRGWEGKGGQLSLPAPRLLELPQHVAAARRGFSLCMSTMGQFVQAPQCLGLCPAWPKPEASRDGSSSMVTLCCFPTLPRWRGPGMPRGTCFPSHSQHLFSPACSATS